MDNAEMFRIAAATLEAGQPLALVTVISTTGSTPGKVGYKMLVFGEGPQSVGTVGGGLVEAKAIESAGRMLGRSECRLLQFDLGETPGDEKGICGGSIDLLVETFDAPSALLFAGLLEEVKDGEKTVMVSIIAADGLPRKTLIRDADRFEGTGVGSSKEIAEALRCAVTNEVGVRICAGPIEAFIEPLVSRPRLVLFGAGHVAGHVARLAKAVHFRVTVCDDRAEYANAERFPDAEEIVVEDFSRVFNKVRIDERSYLAIVTRGHQYDEIVLEQAVRTDARYIGMIGSRRKTFTLIENLKAKGVPTDRLARVYAPIGIAIGAVTAEEIALSIVCELVKIRRLGDKAEVGHMTLSQRRSES